MSDPHPSATYATMASRTAAQVIASYSSSFSLATRLLSARIRQDIRNLYAVVRIADEIVDGAAPNQHKTQLLAEYEQAVLNAPLHQFHTDPVLHAYAGTARACRIAPQHMRAFFRSMQMDLQRVTHTQDSVQDYIYGSAEVIGLMCLAIFLKGQHRDQQQLRTLEDGARNLGAAFQRINFLRDAGEDLDVLGRRYLPVDGKEQVIAQIRRELAVASHSVPLLPPDVVAGVGTAIGIFAELTDRIEALPAADARRRRVRVPAPRKVGIVISNIIRRRSLVKGTPHAFGS